MQIITISSARLPERVWLKFDDDSLLPLKVDDVISLKLKKFVDLSASEYDKVQKHSASYLLYEYAIRQLAISPKTRLALDQKLRLYSQKIIFKYNYTHNLVSSLITTTLGIVEEKGLINDAEFVAYYIRRHPRKSLMDLKFSLQRLGVDLKDHPHLFVSEKDKIRLLITKKLRHQDLTDVNTKNKLISFLCRKGFALGDVKSIIDEILNSR
jgi:SOS response regulatory protein OraA/RecX